MIDGGNGETHNDSTEGPGPEASAEGGQETSRQERSQTGEIGGSAACPVVEEAKQVDTNRTACVQSNQAKGRENVAVTDQIELRRSEEIIALN